MKGKKVNWMRWVMKKWQFIVIFIVEIIQNDFTEILNTADIPSLLSIYFKNTFVITFRYYQIELI